MFRIVIVSLILMISTLCVIFIYTKNDSIPESKLTNNKSSFDKLKINDLPEEVKEINSRNQLTKSISCKDISVKIWSGGHRYRLNGAIHYKKPQMFRMTIGSVLGKELDIGSNDSHIWYWSRRDKRPGLYYAKHEDFTKTRLKTPFNPAFLIASLGASEMPLKDCIVLAKNDNYMLSYPKQSAMGKPLTFSIFVSKSRKQIDGYVISDSSGRTLAVCDIQGFTGVVPSKILYTWHEEDHIMLLSLENPTVNQEISPKMWEMPDYKPKINMAESR